MATIDCAHRRCIGIKEYIDQNICETMSVHFHKTYSIVLAKYSKKLLRNGLHFYRRVTNSIKLAILNLYFILGTLGALLRLL